MGDTEDNHPGVEGRSSGGSSSETLRNSKVRAYFNTIGTVLVAALLVWAIISWIHHYRSEDHSVYGKLAQTTYSQNGLHFSFEYPSVMTKDASMASRLPSAPVAYTYYANKDLQAVVAVSHEAIGSNLRILSLKPSQYISQIREGTGSYLNALNYLQNIKDSAKVDFPGCTQTVVTESGQTTVLCVNNPSDYINARIIGATETTQYTLELIMKPSVWTAHQMAWKKVERSFSFQ